MSGGNSLNRIWLALFFLSFLAWHFVHFHAAHESLSYFALCYFTSTPNTTSLYLSLSLFHHAGHEHSLWAPVSLSFRKWGVWHNRETKLMCMRQFFFMSLLPLFQLMKLHLFFSCPCSIKRFITVNLNSYKALNYVRQEPIIRSWWEHDKISLIQKHLNLKIYLEILVSKPFHNLKPALLNDIIITNVVSFVRKLSILHCPNSPGIGNFEIP